jgi:beta-glucanase (GH16 family)
MTNAASHIKMMIFAACMIMGFARCQSSTSNQLYQLVWTDEFVNSGLPDTALWSFTQSNSLINNKKDRLQLFTTQNLLNARCDGDYLHIRALSETVGDYQYTSSQLLSKNYFQFKEGKIAIRAKMAGGRGITSLIGIVNDTTFQQTYCKQNQISIATYFGNNPSRLYYAYHSNNDHTSAEYLHETSHYSPNTDREFHEFTFIWSPQYMQWYINNQLVYKASAKDSQSGCHPASQPFQILLTVMVGGTPGGLHGIDPEAFPASMIIDYIRVYKKTKRGKLISSQR